MLIAAYATLAKNGKHPTCSEISAQVIESKGGEDPELQKTPFCETGRGNTAGTGFHNIPRQQGIRSQHRFQNSGGTMPEVGR